MGCGSRLHGSKRTRLGYDSSCWHGARRMERRLRQGLWRQSSGDVELRRERGKREYEAPNRSQHWLSDRWFGKLEVSFHWSLSRWRYTSQSNHDTQRRWYG